MARKKKHAIDASIIDLLMTNEDAMTATEIAKAVGFSKAKDVTNRLLSLNQKGVVMKSKFNKSVYWSCESELANVTIRGENVYASDDAIPADDGGVNQPASVLQPSGYSDRTLDVLYNTIVTLQNTVVVLRDELNAQKRLFTDIFDHIRSHAIENSEIDQSKIDTSDIALTNERSSLEITPVATNVSTPYPLNLRATAPSAPASPTPTAPVSSARSTVPVSPGRMSAPVSPAPSSATASPARSSVTVTASPVRSSATASPDNSSALQLDMTSYANVTARRPNRVTISEPSKYRHPLAGVTTADIAECIAPVSDDVREIVVDREPVAMREKEQMTQGGWKSSWREPLVAVVGDSMIKRMSSHDIKKRTTTTPTFVRPFSGAKIEDMFDYILPVLRRRPDVVVLHIGTNDLGDRSLTSEEIILQRLDELVKFLQDSGVIVIISFVIGRCDMCINSRIRNYNKLLLDYCARNSIIFIDNDNIDFMKISRDGVHLNAEGASILCDNIAKCIDYVIPYCFGR